MRYLVKITYHGIHEEHFHETIQDARDAYEAICQTAGNGVKVELYTLILEDEFLGA